MSFKRKKLNAKYEIVTDAEIILPGSDFKGKVSDIVDANLVEAMISRGSSLVRRKSSAPEKAEDPSTGS